MFQANPWGILAIVAVVMSWALAILLFRVSTPGSVARKLSLLLVIEGLTLGSSSAPMFVPASPADFIHAAEHGAAQNAAHFRTGAGSRHQQESGPGTG